jgi:hypothetical protein
VIPALYTRKATLSLQSGRLRWKWRSSATVAQSDFGDPTTSTSYQVCLYDASGLKLSARAPVDGTCGNEARPCWSTLSTTGYRFKDSTGTPNGLTKILLKAGGPGRGKISLRGQGANLQTTATPFTTPVRMQYLRNGSSLCWDATYTTSTRNDTSGFKAKSD